MVNLNQEESVLSSLVINEVESQEVYELMKQQGLINDQELYLIPDEGGSTVQPPEGYTITLLATNWDENKSQTIKVAGVSEQEDTQLIHILPKDQEGYLADGIKGEVAGAGQIKFTATTTPTKDYEVFIVIEDVGLVYEDGLINKIISGPKAYTFYATAAADAWTQDGDFYYQEVQVDNMSEAYSPIVSCVLDDDQAQNKVIKENWSLINDIDTMDGAVKFWATGVPEIELTAKFVVMGWYEVTGPVYPDAEGVEF